MRRLIILLMVILTTGCSQPVTVQVTAISPVPILPEPEHTPLPSRIALPEATLSVKSTPSPNPKRTALPPKITTPDWKELLLPPGCRFEALSPDSQWVAYACGQQVGWLAPIKAGQLYNPIRMDVDIWLSFTPDSSSVIGVMIGKQTARWQLMTFPDLTWKRDIISDTQLWLGAIVWSPDGSALAACNYSCSQIYLLDPDDWTYEQIVDAPGRYSAQYGWSPDSREIVYVWGDGLAGDKSVSVRIVNRQSHQSRVLLESKLPLTGVSWSPSGDWIAVRTESDSNETRLWLVDPRKGEKIERVFDWGGPDRLEGWGDLVWSPDGTKLALQDGHVIEVPSGKVVLVVDSYILPLMWSTNGTSLLVKDSDWEQGQDILRWVSVQP